MRRMPKRKSQHDAMHFFYHRICHLFYTMLKIPINSMFSRKTEEPDRDAAGIPYASRQDIQSLRSEYEQKTRDAQDPSLESCFKYVNMYM
jgi:hypothetical protein